ncbi:MAG: AtpZ/AtpI family protein [Alphaproteobacteria bacterium]
MSDTNGNSSEPTGTSNLSDLEQRLNAARQKHEDKKPSETDNSALGMAWRISTELVVAVIIGCALGFGIDYFAGTKPLFTIVGLVLGTAAGIRNTFRLVLAMEKAEEERLSKLDDV